MTPNSTYFEVKVKYDHLDPMDGIQKVKTDVYLIDALSFTEAEASGVSQAQTFSSGWLSVDAIKRAKITEVFEFASGDKFFKAKVVFISVDEKGKEKRSASTMLIQADDIKEARERLEESMAGTMSDYEVAKIEETAILEVIPYYEPETTEAE